MKTPRMMHNWISLSGVILTLASCFSFVFLLAIDRFAHQGNPYLGILTYAVTPGFFALGCLLMVLGAWTHRRGSRKGADLHSAITIDLSRPRDQKLLIAFAAGTLVFLLVTASGTYGTYRYTESVMFCGLVCHKPMKPEYVAYQVSPHANVRCTECHIGSGAGQYVKAKFNGLHQLTAVIKNDYDRPIATPLKGIRSAAEICEQCHWKDRDAGVTHKTYRHFLADEDNTEFTVQLLLNVGGASNSDAGGIHWHMNSDNKVEYIAVDDQRQQIPWVRLTTSDGEVTEYTSIEWDGDLEGHEIRTMDCLDCHNRPAHRFHTPNDAVDRAMASGHLDTTLPWLKSNLVQVLSAPYETEEAGITAIEDQLTQRYPDASDLNTMIAETQTIFRHNIFPEMKADWRAYPDNISHKDWPGCFRCHDGWHETADGAKTLSATSCNSCHVIVSQGAGDDLQNLSAEGHTFFHIDAEYEDFSCAECHNGALMEE